MRLDVDASDLEPIVAAAVDAVLAKRDQLGDRLGYPEPEAARLLGVAPYVLRDARRRGEINGRRVGRSIVYSREALVAWLTTDDGDRTARGPRKEK